MKGVVYNERRFKKIINNRFLKKIDIIDEKREKILNTKNNYFSLSLHSQVLK